MNRSDFQSNLYESKSIVLVTGATGWVGRSVLHELQKLILPSNFNDLVYAFGSKSGSVNSTAYKLSARVSIPIYPLSEISNMARNRNILLFHTAFLTKDRLEAYGYSSFVEINRWITKTVCEAVSLASQSRVVGISSGAASLAEQRAESCLHDSLDPYGFLKLREEELLSEFSVTQILRVFALTGRFIRDPLSFAIGDFLMSAVKGSRISIRSKGPVIRGYVNASDLAQTALHWINSDESALPPLPAVTHTITLATLAKYITSIYQIPAFVSAQHLEPPNSYSASPGLFLDLMNRFSLSPMPMRDQILDTAFGLQAGLGVGPE